MIQTLAFNARLPVLLGASPFYQTPNAPIARGLELTEKDYVKARLTALAIETDQFSRDDIYTLFVTTRIINFLKGLPITGDASLEELMDQSWSDPRTNIGFELLRKLLWTGCLDAWTKSGRIEKPHFDSGLLRRVLIQVEEVAAQTGKKISVRDFARSLPAGAQVRASGTVTRKVAPAVLGSNEISPL
jgi:hypothetical protein